MFGRRRWTALAATCASGALALAACNSGSPTPVRQTDPTSSASSSSATPTTGPVRLTFGVYGRAPVVAAYRQAVAAFNATEQQKHKNVSVVLRSYASPASALTAAESSTPPDVFLVDGSDLPEVLSGKLTKHVDNLLADRGVNFGDGFERGALEVFSAKAQLQCMPVDFSPMVLYYNTDLLDPQEVDVQGKHDPAVGFSMDELKQAATLATGPGHRGIAVDPGLEQLAPFVWSAGGGLVDNPKSPAALTLESGNSQKGISQFLEVVRNPQVTFTQKQLASRSSVQRFEAGQVGMILGYRDLVPQLRTHPRLHFDAMPVPRVSGYATVARTTGACISAKSPHSGAAADFVASLVSDDSMSRLADTGYLIPPNLDVLNDDAFLQPGRQPGHADAYLDSMRGAELMPGTETWPRVVAATRSAIAALWYDVNIDPLDARLKAIDALAQPILTPPTPTATPTGTPSGSGTPSPSPSSSPSG